MNHRLTIEQTKRILNGNSKLSHNREFMHRFTVLYQKDCKFARNYGASLR